MILGRDHFTRPWQSLEAVHNITGEGRVLGGVLLDDGLLEVLVDLIDEGLAADEVTIARDYDIAFALFVLIGEVSDDDLDEVMEGDDTFGASVFVLHYRDVFFLFLEGIEDLDRRSGEGDGEGFREVFPQAKVFFVIVLEEILHFQYTHHGIETLISNDKTRVHTFLDFFEYDFLRVTDIDPVDIISVGDDRLGTLVGEGKNIVME